MVQKRVGVLRGGAEDYSTSLKEGGDVISFLTDNLSTEYKPLDILVDIEGAWHFSGMPILPADLPGRVDMVWNSASPGYARVLKNFAVPHVSAPHFAESLRESREMLREHMRDVDVHLPRHIVIPMYQRDIDGQVEKFAFRKAKEVHEKFGAPWVVKSFPPSPHSGVRVVNTFAGLMEAVREAAEGGRSISVEELVSESSARAHALQDFRGESPYVMLTHNLAGSEKERAEEVFRSLYECLDAGPYLYGELYFHPKRGVFLSDLRFLPSLHKDSHFHEACANSGNASHQMVKHMLECAMS